MKPEGTHNNLLADLAAVLFLRRVGEEVNVGVVVVLKNLNDKGFDFGECTNDSAHVGDYEGVDKVFELHGA